MRVEVRIFTIFVLILSFLSPLQVSAQQKSGLGLKTVVIDPGHGGKDPGASGNGIVEKNYNLNMRLYRMIKWESINEDNESFKY